MSRDVAGAVNVLLIVLVAVLMVSASTVAIILFQGGQSEESSGDIVQVGQTIKVEYIGKLTDGRVFDTSNYTIAANDAEYPKTLTFTLRSKTSYVPLSFVVGGGQMISGFDSAVVGMRVGETKTVTLSPDQAYGDMDPSKLVTFDLDETLPLLETYTITGFKSVYGVNAAQGLTVSDPFYGWPVSVLQVDEDANLVTVKNSPTMGEEYRIYGNSTSGWDVLVTGIDSGSDSITIHHQVEDADSDYVKGKDGANTFILTSVDTDGGTAVRNYNTELLGKSLVFTITVTEIVDQA